MKKAILLVGLKADELPKYAYADVYIFGKYCDDQEDDFLAHLIGCPLKPMPKMKQHEEEIDYDYGYIDGWNDCLAEITGDTE